MERVERVEERLHFANLYIYISSNGRLAFVWQLRPSRCQNSGSFVDQMPPEAACSCRIRLDKNSFD